MASMVLNNDDPMNIDNDNRDDDSVSISSNESFEVLDEPSDSSLKPPRSDEVVDALSMQSTTSTLSSNLFMSEITQRVHDLVEENKCFKGLLQQNNLIFNEHLANLAKWQEDIESCQQKMKKQYEESNDTQKLLLKENEELRLKLQKTLPNENQEKDSHVEKQETLCPDFSSRVQSECHLAVSKHQPANGREKKSEENVTDKSGELATDNLQAELVVERRMRNNLEKILEAITRTDDTENNILHLKPLLAELGIMLTSVEPMMSKYFDVREEMKKVIDVVRRNSESDTLLTQLEYLSVMLQTGVSKRSFDDLIVLVHRLESILTVYEDHVKAQKEVHQDQINALHEKVQCLCNEKIDLEKQIVTLHDQLSAQKREYTEKIESFEKEKLSWLAELDSLKKSQSEQAENPPRQMYRCPVCSAFFPTAEGIQGHIDDCLAGCD